MKKTIKFLILSFLKRIHFNAIINDLALNEANQIFKTNATFNDKKVSFGITAKIINLQNNKTKIIIGDQTYVYGTLLVFFYGGEIQIGSNSYIGDGVRIWSGEKVVIGNDVIIGHNTNIIDTNPHEIDLIERQNSVRNQLKIGYQDTKGNIDTDSIHIKDNVWISFGVSILKGVTIGQGAVIAANSVVTKDVEPFTMVGGNPAVFIKKISNETTTN